MDSLHCGSCGVTADCRKLMTLLRNIGNLYPRLDRQRSGYLLSIGAASHTERYPWSREFRWCNVLMNKCIGNWNSFGCSVVSFEGFVDKWAFKSSEREADSTSALANSIQRSKSRLKASFLSLNLVKFSMWKWPTINHLQVFSPREKQTCLMDKLRDKIIEILNPLSKLWGHLRPSRSTESSDVGASKGRKTANKVAKWPLFVGKRR